MKSFKKTKQNSDFFESLALNNQTYAFYLERLRRIATIIFSWENLPASMNERYLEEALFLDGQASVLYDENYGIINTRCTSGGYLNIYGLPSEIMCYSYDYNTRRKLFTGIIDKENDKLNTCVYIMNNYDRIPTLLGIELFAYRLYQAQRTQDINLNAQKTPIIISVDESDRMFMKNLFNQYNGNRPFIFGDKNKLNRDSLKTFNIQAPYVIDKIEDYKKAIWNECLTYLGINNIADEKRERLLEAEANQNNEIINLNLQASYTVRKKAVEQINELFDTDIKVKLRSDLKNVIKETESIIIQNREE